MSFRQWVFRRSLAAWVAVLIAGIALAQPAPPPATPPPAVPVYSAQQLDNLVAPLALYPDPLLSQVLVACTYPLELVEAQQWLQRNNGLTGTALMDAARQQNWDASIQALVAFPDVLAKLNQDIRWTTDLGNAFLAQQGDVMQAVQRMRASAQANGKLSSTPQDTVSTESQNGQSAIQIEPANPQVIYVPTYDPAYIWGPAAWGAYPPLYYPAFGFGFDPGFDIGLCFGGWGWGGWGGWGWGPNWFGGSIILNRGFFGTYGFHQGWGGFGRTGIWAHDPAHRLGVSYPNRQLASRFGAASRQGAFRAASRQAALNMGARNAFGQTHGANRGIAQGAQGVRQYGNRFGTQGYQRFGGNPSQRSMRGFQSSPGFRSSPSFQSAPRFSAPHYQSPSFNRGSFGSSGTRGFGGGSFGGAGRSFGGGHSFGGGGHSFGGGGHGGRR